MVDFKTPPEARAALSVYSKAEADAATAVAAASKLSKASNLSDVGSIITARTNLGVYSKAEVAAVDAQKANKASNLSDLASAPIARDNLDVYSRPETDGQIEAEASSRRTADLALSAAMASGGTVYATTAAGLAAVADGATFLVASPDGDGIVVYRRDGAAATQLSVLRSDAPLAQAWAEGVTAPGGVGTKSSKTWAGEAAAAAAGAEVSATQVASALSAKNQQRIAQKLNVGFVGAHGNDELFVGAGNPHQDFDIVTVSGVQKLFAVHKVAGGTYTTDEKIRIAEYNFTGDGTALVPVAYSTEISAGHGQGFTAVVTGASVAFYTTSRTLMNGNGGKGISRITWRGALTDQTDVTSYQLFGDAGSGHRFEKYQNASPCVSTDAASKYIIMAAEVAGKLGNGGKVLVYDRAEVEAAANPLLVSPLSEFVEVGIVQRMDGWIKQGIACDGSSIYTAYGYIAPEHPNYITKTSMAGNFEDRIYATGALDYYGPDGVLNAAAKGPMIYNECEGIAVRDGRIYFGIATAFLNDTPIVTATINGASMNLACVGSTAANEQTNPYSQRRWTRTKLAATNGAWSASTAYTRGSNWTERAKMILEIGARDARTDWFGNTTDWFALNSVPLQASDSVADIIFPSHQALNIAAHGVHGGGEGWATDAVVATDGELRLFDWRYGSVWGVFGRIKREVTAAIKRLSLQAGSGGRLNLWDHDDPTNPGWVQLVAINGANQTVVSVPPDGKVRSSNGFLILPDRYTIADDEMVFIPQPDLLYNWKLSAIMMQAGANSGAWADLTVDVDGSPAVTTRTIGANTEVVASAAFPAATPVFSTYTDNKLTIIAAVGGVYLVNRLGGTKTYGVTWSA